MSLVGEIDRVVFDLAFFFEDADLLGEHLGEDIGLQHGKDLPEVGFFWHSLKTRIRKEGHEDGIFFDLTPQISDAKILEPCE